MRMYDLIMKKRNGGSLSPKEIEYMINEYVRGHIPDYQMAAFLMAVYFKGMTEAETLAMTNVVAHSGEMVDLSSIEGVKVDKHSTGGVGDKTTLVIAPIVAACGVKVAKMSGRGLGHTGGTVDKLESIPGMKTSISRERFFEIVNKIGLSVIGQSGNLAPADKKLYALRDVTATVDSIPLIAVSIMSKKLAAGNDCILLDVKTGSGAFMKTIEDSIALAKEMVSIGENAGKHTVALITDMDNPLGYNIGNSLEVIEAVDTLKGNGPKDLTEVCLNLAANMIYLSDKYEQHTFSYTTACNKAAGQSVICNGNKRDIDICMEMAKQTLRDGSALERLIAMVEAQGGDSSVIKDTSKFQKSPYSEAVTAQKSGYIKSMDTEKCGIASVVLGAGRETKESNIDYSAGIIIHKKVGEYVEKGSPIATLFASDKSLFAQAQDEYQSAIIISDEKPVSQQLIFARVTKDNIENFSK